MTIHVPKSRVELAQMFGIDDLRKCLHRYVNRSEDTESSTSASLFREDFIRSAHRFAGDLYMALWEGHPDSCFDLLEYQKEAYGWFGNTDSKRDLTEEDRLDLLIAFSCSFLIEYEKNAVIQSALLHHSKSYAIELYEKLCFLSHASVFSDEDLDERMREIGVDQIARALNDEKALAEMHPKISGCIDRLLRIRDWSVTGRKSTPN